MGTHITEQKLEVLAKMIDQANGCRNRGGQAMDKVLSEAERAFLNHNIRWGSDGYPIQRIGRGWHWNASHGVGGCPKVFKTKKEASAAIEAYVSLLCDRLAGRV